MSAGDIKARAGEVFDGLKSKLSLSRNSSERDSYDRYTDDNYDDYDDYDDYGQYADGAYDSNDSYGSYDNRGDKYYKDDYEDYSSDYRSRSASAGYIPAGSDTRRSNRTSRFGRSESGPKLVSIDDVKARTQVPDTLLRDPLGESSASGSTHSSMTLQSSGRNLVQSSQSRASSPSYDALRQNQQDESRSTGLDSLFESSQAQKSGASYDPYDTYSGLSSASYTASRRLSVIKPQSYSDVERVARALKAGDVVVLSMRNTPDDLSKRVLDFSFGVASALDANVESPRSKVFAIARGRGLSDTEKMNLRSQGVL